ncbi:hypothetical protein, partial [Eubacterium ventriosum]|uniref:hypothetical protein n=1 Tax=Eubacterium ventriosum TaxID=39496 RepID=UPI0039995898
GSHRSLRQNSYLSLLSLGFRGFFTKANNEEGSASSGVLSFLYCILGNSGTENNRQIFEILRA